MKINHRIMRTSISHTNTARAEERAPQRLLSKRRISSLVNKFCSFIKFHHRQPEFNAATKLFHFAAAFGEQEVELRSVFFQSTDRAVNICCSATPWQRAWKNNLLGNERHMFAMGAANNYRGVQRVSRMSYVFCKASQKSPFASAPPPPPLGHGPHTFICSPRRIKTPKQRRTGRDTCQLCTPRAALVCKFTISIGTRASPFPPVHFASNKTALNLSDRKGMRASCCHVRGELKRVQRLNWKK